MPQHTDFEVNGRKYRAFPWSAYEAMEKYLWVLKTANPLVFAFIEVWEQQRKSKAEGENKDFDSLRITQLLQGIDPVEIVRVARLFTEKLFLMKGQKGGQIEAVPIDPDAHFDEYPADLLPVIMEVGIFQLNPFLNGKSLPSIFKKTASDFQKT